MIESLQSLLSFDSALIAVFAGLSMMVVQMLKASIPFVDRNPMLYVLALALFWATMVVYEVTEVLAVGILTFLIMSAASGVYSASKNKVVVDFSDEL